MDSLNSDSPWSRLPGSVTARCKELRWRAGGLVLVLTLTLKIPCCMTVDKSLSLPRWFLRSHLVQRVCKFCPIDPLSWRKRVKSEPTKADRKVFDNMHGPLENGAVQKTKQRSLGELCRSGKPPHFFTESIEFSPCLFSRMPEVLGAPQPGTWLLGELPGSWPEPVEGSFPLLLEQECKTGFLKMNLISNKEQFKHR